MMNNKGVLQLIYKVLFQADKTQSPLREATKSIYLEADSAVEARQLVEDNTPYNLEFVQELSGKHLAFEQESEDFKLTEF